MRPVQHPDRPLGTHDIRDNTGAGRVHDSEPQVFNPLLDYRQRADGGRCGRRNL